MRPPIYLDNSTTARPSEKSVSAMMPYWTRYWGLPSAPHQKGQELYPLLTEHFKTLYHCLGAHEEDQLVLTSSGAEAVNHVIASVYREISLRTGKNQFLMSAMDEAPSMMAASHLEPFSCIGKMVPVNREGLLTPEALSEVISPRTALVSMSWANGLTGVVQPVRELAKVCRQRGVRLHLEMTHVIGKLFYEKEELEADYFTLNGDPLHAPKGTGLLYAKRGIPLSPFICGSADQGGLRAGGLNMPALAGLACALQEALENRDLLCTEIARLRSRLEKGVLKGFPQAQVCFKQQERLPHCTTLLFPGIANEALLFALNQQGLCATIGGGNFQQLGWMLAGAGIEETLAHSAVSFSLSRYTTEEEIDRSVEIIVEKAQMLRRLSQHLLI